MSLCALCHEKAPTCWSRHYGVEMPFCSAKCSSLLCEAVRYAPGDACTHEALIGVSPGDTVDGIRARSRVKDLIEGLTLSGFGAGGAGTYNLPLEWPLLPADIRIMVLTRVPLFSALALSSDEKTRDLLLSSEVLWREFYVRSIVGGMGGTDKLLLPTWREQTIAYLEMFDFVVLNEKTGLVEGFIPVRSGASAPTVILQTDAETRKVSVRLSPRLQEFLGGRRVGAVDIVTARGLDFSPLSSVSFRHRSVARAKDSGQAPLDQAVFHWGIEYHYKAADIPLRHDDTLVVADTRHEHENLLSRYAVSRKLYYPIRELRYLLVWTAPVWDWKRGRPVQRVVSAEHSQPWSDRYHWLAVYYWPTGTIGVSHFDTENPRADRRTDVRIGLSLVIVGPSADFYRKNIPRIPTDGPGQVPGDVLSKIAAEPETVVGVISSDDETRYNVRIVVKVRINVPYWSEKRRVFVFTSTPVGSPEVEIVGSISAAEDEDVILSITQRMLFVPREGAIDREWLESASGRSGGSDSSIGIDLPGPGRDGVSDDVEWHLGRIRRGTPLVFLPTNPASHYVHDVFSTNVGGTEGIASGVS